MVAYPVILFPIFQFFILFRIGEVRWSGTDLVVVNEVAVSPPYGPVNVRGKTPDSKAYIHVKKLVEQHQQLWQERLANTKDTVTPTAEQEGKTNVRH